VSGEVIRRTDCWVVTRIRTLAGSALLKGETMTAEIGVLAFIVLLTIVGIWVTRNILRSRNSVEAKEERVIDNVLRTRKELEETDVYLDELNEITSEADLEKRNRNRRRNN
jgi:hypothetical protein